MPRLFLGSFLTPEQQIQFQQLENPDSNLAQKWRCHVRWVNCHKLHLTWHFLGEIDEHKRSDLLETIADCLNKQNSSPDLTVIHDCLELWSINAIPKHIVLTPKTPPTQLLTLVSKIRADLKPFVSEHYQNQANKPFRPHITLIHLRKEGNSQPHISAQPVAEHPLNSKERLEHISLDCSQIPGLSTLIPLKQQLTSVSIIESKSQGSSHQYEIIKTFPLSRQS